jgi:hypothetical protein
METIFCLPVSIYWVLYYFLLVDSCFYSYQGYKRVAVCCKGSRRYKGGAVCFIDKVINRPELSGMFVEIIIFSERL